eukprot:6492726-Amphidinium_carterae.7
MQLLRLQNVKQVWYTEQKALRIRRLYVIALLSATFLRDQGLQFVPHVVVDDSVYERMLRGIAPKPEELQRPRRKEGFDADVRQSTDYPVAKTPRTSGPRASRDTPAEPIEPASGSTGPPPVQRFVSEYWGAFRITARQARRQIEHAEMTRNDYFQ